MVRRVSWVNPEEIVGGPGGLRAPGRSIKLKIKGYPKEKEEAKSKKKQKQKEKRKKLGSLSVYFYIPADSNLIRI